MRRAIRFALAICLLSLAPAARLHAAPAQGSISCLVFDDLNSNGLQDANGRPQELGHPDAWHEDVVQLRPKPFRLPGNGPAESPDAC